jgi:integrase
MAGNTVMSEPIVSMVVRVESYLKWKRNLGYSLTVVGRELLRFARFADDNKHVGPITTALVLNWAQSAEGCSRLYRARRVEMARTLARFEASFEPNTQIPQRGILGPAHQRIQPYIYTQNEIDGLMSTAMKLNPIGGLRSQSYSTLIGLIASTGLRVCEALHLRRADFEPENNRLIIRDTKFHKSRIVPISSSVTEAMCEYAQFRDKYRGCVSITTDRFLVSEQGRPLLPSAVYYTFGTVRNRIHFENPHNERAPRLYDLRHTFACRVLQRWYSEGVDVNVRLPYLSTYLGHVKPTDTYWYLSAIPELMKLALSRFSDNAVNSGGLL